MKKFILGIIALAITLNTFSQSYTPPAYADIDNNYRNYVNNLFGSLEPNRVATGLLIDYAFDFAEPKAYNGSVLVDSTLMEQGIYSELYKTIYTSRFNNSAGTLRHPSIHDSLCYIARQKETITLSGLLFNYNAIDPNAQANGKMQTINGQLRDVYNSGVWQNPYQEFTTVAISPSIISYNRTHCSVKLPANLFLSNMATLISSIQFDAGDGLGYRNLQFDVPVSLNYADTGWKHWVFRITLTNSQQLYSHSKVHFNNTSNIGNGPGARGVIDRQETVIATEAFNGAFGSADIIISYRNANDQEIRRPLIIAEGFDAGRIIDPEEDEGTNSFLGFINSVGISGSAQLINLIGNPFNPNAPSEYDIIYINWNNGTDWLQRNALVLEEVIRWVNNNKQPLNGVMQPNVVLGSSMGGVIARMALGRMDRGEGPFNIGGGFNAHRTNLYVSLDAPHQGANVPLGYQAAARHAARVYISTGPAVVGFVELVQLLANGPSPLLSTFLADQPAARQLLSNRIDFFFNTVNAPYNNFMNELRTQWQYPVNIRNIAISNGNECAIDQEFAAGSSLLYHYRSTKTRLITDLTFMLAGAGLIALNVSPFVVIPLMVPGSSKFELTLDIKSLANNGGNQVYYGNIKLTKKVLWLVPVSINLANKTYNAPTGLLPFDTYPGGFYTVELANQPGTVSQDWMFTYNNSFYIQRRFSFIPTTSALDIGGGNVTLTNADYIRRYIGQTPPIAPLNSQFANFATAFNTNGVQGIFDNNNFRRLNNEPHEGFFIRNANWLADEMNGINTVRTNCEAFCANGSIIVTSASCTTATFTAPFGAGAIYSWSVNYQGLVTNANGNTFTVTDNNGINGILIVTVQITGACGTITLTKSIAMGVPTQQVVIGTEGGTPSQYCINYIYTFYYEVPNTNTDYVTNYKWGIIDNNSNISYLPYSGSSISHVFSSPGSYALFVEPENDCGSGYRTFYYVEVADHCGGFFKVNSSPNPAQGELYVSVSDEKELVKALSKDEIVLIELYDFYTKQNVRQWRFKNDQKQYKLNISGLKKGMYVLSVSKGKYRESKQIIIE